MDWRDLGVTLIKAGAPIIGTALGGPLGGTLGGMLGSIVASALGVEPTPEAVSTAITSGDPATVQAKLAAAETEAASKWDAIAKIAQSQADVDKANIEAVNTTMRAESAAGVKWWHWRHLIGYATLLWAVAVLPPFIWAMWRGDAGWLGVITTALTSAIPYFGIIAGLNGYVAQDTTRLRAVAMVGEHQDTVSTSIAKAITGAVKKK